MTQQTRGLETTACVHHHAELSLRFGSFSPNMTHFCNMDPKTNLNINLNVPKNKLSFLIVECMHTLDDERKIDWCIYTMQEQMP